MKITGILTAFFNQEIIMKCPEGSNYTIPQMKGLRTITQETLLAFHKLDIYRLAELKSTNLCSWPTPHIPGSSKT